MSGNNTARLISGIALCFVAIFILASLLNFDPLDPNVFLKMETPQRTTINNYCGMVGANLSAVLMLFIGYASFTAPLILGAWAFMLLSHKEISYFYVRLACGLLFFIAFAALIELVWPTTGDRLILANGGSYGLMCAKFLSGYMKPIGAILLTGFWALCTLIVAVDRVFVILYGFGHEILNAWRVKKAAAAQASLKAAKEDEELRRKAEKEARENAKKVKQEEKARAKAIALEAKMPAEEPPQESVAEESNSEEIPKWLRDREIEEQLEVEFREKQERQKSQEEKKAPEKKAPVVEEAPEEEYVDEPELQHEVAITPPPVRKPEPPAPPKPVPAPPKAAPAPAPPSPPAHPKEKKSNLPNPNYEFPQISILDLVKAPEQDQAETLERKARTIEMTLADFRIEAKVVGTEIGPAVTMFELALAPGIEVQKVLRLHDNLAMALKAVSVRIQAPIPGKATIGIEVPNLVKQTVRMRDIMEREDFEKNTTKMKLPMIMGKDNSGEPLILDLNAMPHMLVAGATGSGKSVCLNSIILSFLMLRSPDELKLIMVDPKMVEMSMYNGIPHLMSPVVTDMNRAPRVLEWAVNEMERRYEYLSRVGARELTKYNKIASEGFKDIDLTEEERADMPDFMPYVVVIVDELADLMMRAAKEIENSIIRLAQKSRAVGIHVILATQRPSADVITGLIKANMPSRVAFKVTSKVNSNIILDVSGAEKLLGQGDMLILPPASSKLIRSQGVYVTDEEIQKIVEFVKSKQEPAYEEELFKAGTESGPVAGPGDSDELFDDAVRVVLTEKRGSVSLLQRKLGVGYTRAARLIEMMEEEKILGPHQGSKPRDIFMSLDQWESVRAGRGASASSSEDTGEQYDEEPPMEDNDQDNA